MIDFKTIKFLKHKGDSLLLIGKIIEYQESELPDLGKIHNFEIDWYKIDAGNNFFSEFFSTSVIKNHTQEWIAANYYFFSDEKEALIYFTAQKFGL